MRSIVLLACLPLLASAACSGEEPPEAPATPEPQASLDPAFEAALSEVLQQQHERLGTPGLAVAVRPPGRGTWSMVVGSADAGGSTPLTRTARFKVGSLTETLVMPALFGLQSDEFSVHRLAHEQLTGLPDSWPVTVRQMLSHTSGVPDYADHPDFDPFASLTRAELIALAEELEVQHGPGAQWSPTLTDYVYASLVIERLTDTPWAEYLGATFLKPYELGNTALPEGLDWGEVVPCYASGEDVTALNTPGGGAGAANATMSVGNVATWGAALFGGEVLDGGEVAGIVGDPFHQNGRSYGPAIEVLDEGGPKEEWAHRIRMRGVSGWMGYRPDLGTSLALLANDERLAIGMGADVMEEVAAPFWAVIEEHVEPLPPGDDDDATSIPPDPTGQLTLHGLHRHDPSGTSADPSHDGVVIGGWWDFDQDGRTVGRITLTSARFGEGDGADSVECSFEANGSFGPGWGPLGSVGSLVIDEWGQPSCGDWGSAGAWRDRIAGNLDGLSLVPLGDVPAEWTPTWDGWTEEAGPGVTLRQHIEDWSASRPGIDVPWVVLGRIDGLTEEEPQVAPWTFLGWFWQ